MFADDDSMLDFFAAKAGRPLAHTFYTQVVVDGDAAQEMSSFSVLGRDILDARVTEPQEDWLVAHEMAHQYWGNSVTCAEWPDFWLNEGVTVFMVAAYKEQRWGRAAYDREMSLARHRHQLAIDAKFDVPLNFAGEYPSPRIQRAIVYSKAALFFDVLRTTMGEDAFWRAMQKYTITFAGQSVNVADFQRTFAAETEKNLSALFGEWVYGTPVSYSWGDSFTGRVLDVLQHPDAVYAYRVSGPGTGFEIGGDPEAESRRANMVALGAPLGDSQILTAGQVERVRSALLRAADHRAPSQHTRCSGCGPAIAFRFVQGSDRLDWGLAFGTDDWVLESRGATYGGLLTPAGHKEWLVLARDLFHHPEDMRDVHGLWDPRPLNK